MRGLAYYVCFLPACSLRSALRGQVTLLCLQCVPLFRSFFTTELVSFFCEASARALVVLGVDGSISSMSRTHTAAILDFLGAMDLKYKKCAAGELKNVTPVTSVPVLVLRLRT